MRDGKRFMLGRRNRGLAFTYSPSKLMTVDAGETVNVAGMLATGFLLEIEARIIVHQGDTLKLLNQWTGIPRPIEVTKALRPCTVIPCHHNLPSFFKKNANPTDVRGFAEAVEAIGTECRVLSRAETVTV